MGRPVEHRAPDDLRTRLADKWRAFAHSYSERAGLDPADSIYLQRADALDRGETVRVPAWEVALELPGVAGHGSVSIGPDGVEAA